MPPVAVSHDHRAVLGATDEPGQWRRHDTDGSQRTDTGAAPAAASRGESLAPTRSAERSGVVHRRTSDLIGATQPQEPQHTPDPVPNADIWHTVYEGFMRMADAVEHDLSQSGCTIADLRVLVILSQSDKQAMRMTDLAARLGLSPSGVTRRLDSMVRVGYVERVGSPKDRRVMMAVLTDAGRSALDRLMPEHTASTDRNFFDQLTVEEAATLYRIMQRFTLTDEN